MLSQRARRLRNSPCGSARPRGPTRGHSRSDGAGCYPTLLLELGHEPLPEGNTSPVGPLELWMHKARAELSGQAPLEALLDADGETKVRECLRTVLEEMRPRTGRVK